MDSCFRAAGWWRHCSPGIAVSNTIAEHLPITGFRFVYSLKIGIIHGTMYRADVEPMPDNPPDRVEHTGLWKVVIYDDHGDFVRTDKDYISYFEARRLSEKLNGWMNTKSKAAGK